MRISWTMIWAAIFPLNFLPLYIHTGAKPVEIFGAYLLTLILGTAIGTRLDYLDRKKKIR